MAVPFSNTKLRVPRGFQTVLEGLAREVLRSQPGDIQAFAVTYFERLLKIRAGWQTVSHSVLLLLLGAFPTIRGHGNGIEYHSSTLSCPASPSPNDGTFVFHPVRRGDIVYTNELRNVTHVIIYLLF